MKRRYLCGLLVLFGCAGATEETLPSTVTTTSALIAASVDTTEKTQASPAPVETFTDDQVIGLVATANMNAIDLASIARERASDSRVKRLAGLLGAEHTEARDQEARLSERLAMRPASTAKMRAMQLECSNAAERLNALSGHAFDVEYLQNQVEMQRDALAMIDLQLIPSARIAEIRAHLADLREHVDHHLRDVESLQQSVGARIASR